MKDLILQITATTGLSVGLIAVLAYFFREWIILRLSKSIQHEYNTELEEFKSDLRRQEKEINSVRETALMSALDGHRSFNERKAKAIDDLWAGFLETQKMVAAVHMISPLKLDKISEDIKNPIYQEFISSIVKPLNIDPENISIENSIRGRSSRPWIPENIWSVYAAYSSVVMEAVVLFKCLDCGLDTRKFINQDPLLKALEKALPDLSIDWNKITNASWPTLLEILETKLLMEIRKEVSPKYRDEQALERIKSMSDKINNPDSQKIQ
jgi:hypothetical protein